MNDHLGIYGRKRRRKDYSFFLPVVLLSLRGDLEISDDSLENSDLGL